MDDQRLEELKRVICSPHTSQSERDRATSQFVHMTAPTVSSAIRMCHIAESDCEDVMQTGFSKIFNNLHTQRDKNALNMWVRRIAYHAAKDQIDLYIRERRWRSSWPETRSADGHTMQYDPEDSVNEFLDVDLREIRDAALDGLDKVDYHVYILRAGLKETAKDISVMLDISIASVNRAMKRAERHVEHWRNNSTYAEFGEI